MTIPASPLGKIKMASQVTAILLLILGWGPLPWLAPIGHAALEGAAHGPGPHGRTEPEDGLPPRHDTQQTQRPAGDDEVAQILRLQDRRQGLGRIARALIRGHRLRDAVGFHHAAVPHVLLVE